MKAIDAEELLDIWHNATPAIRERFDLVIKGRPTVEVESDDSE